MAPLWGSRAPGRKGPRQLPAGPPAHPRGMEAGIKDGALGDFRASQGHTGSPPPPPPKGTRSLSPTQHLISPSFSSRWHARRPRPMPDKAPRSQPSLHFLPCLTRSPLPGFCSRLHVVSRDRKGASVRGCRRGLRVHADELCQGVRTGRRAGRGASATFPAGAPFCVCWRSLRPFTLCSYRSPLSPRPPAPHWDPVQSGVPCLLPEASPGTPTVLYCSELCFMESILEHVWPCSNSIRAKERGREQYERDH